MFGFRRLLKGIALTFLVMLPCGCDTGGFFDPPDPLGPGLLDGVVWPYTGTWEWVVEFDACEAEGGLLAASDGAEQSAAQHDLYDLESRFTDAAGNGVVFEGHVLRGDITGTLRITDPTTGQEIIADLIAVVVTSERPHRIEGELTGFRGAVCAPDSLPITIRVLP